MTFSLRVRLSYRKLRPAADNVDQGARDKKKSSGAFKAQKCLQVTRPRGCKQSSHGRALLQQDASPGAKGAPLNSQRRRLKCSKRPPPMQTASDLGTPSALTARRGMIIPAALVADGCPLAWPFEPFCTFSRFSRPMPLTQLLLAPGTRLPATTCLDERMDGGMNSSRLRVLGSLPWLFGRQEHR